MRPGLKRSLLLCTAAGAFALTAPTSFGQEVASAEDTPVVSRTLDPVVVTARKQEETLLEAPLSVSAVTGAQLEASGIDSFNQVLNTIPNTGQSGGIAGNIQGLITIRGISTLIRFLGLETGVGFYVDGVYQGRPQNFNQDLIDIDRIEVLRGPQGALFGKNTIAGAINIITKNPSDEFNGLVEVQAGNYNHSRMRAYLSGPLVDDKLSGSISGGIHKRDGFVENLIGGPDQDDADLSTIRGKLRYTPTSNTEFILAVDALTDRSNTLLFEVEDFNFALFPGIASDPSVGTPFTTSANQPNFAHRDIWGVALTSNIDLGSGTLTNILSYREAGFNAALDDDQLPIRVFPDFFSQDTAAMTAELRYAGQIGERSNIILGAYYDNQDSDGFGDFAVGEDFNEVVFGVRAEPPIILDTSMESESFALFFDYNYDLTDQLTLELGGRWVTESKEAVHDQDDQAGFFATTFAELDRTDEDFSPTVSLSYDVNESVSTYVRYAQGFKSAGFNLDFITDPTSLEVEPEKAESFEVGIKSNLFDNRMTLNLAAFFTDYTDLQLSQIVGAGVVVANAANAEIAGLEADFVAVVGDHIDLNGSLGYLDATYEDFAGCPAPGAADPSVVSANCAGNFLNLAPEWTAAFGAQYTHPVGTIGDFVARADLNYRSEVFFEPQNDPRLSGDGRTLVNLRAGIQNDTWELFGWINNATDETYVNYADDRSVIGVNLTNAYGAPQTYGATLRVKF